MKRGLKIIIWSAVTVAAVVIAVWMRNAMRMGDSAEHQAMAMDYINAATCEYIAARHEWPRSWDDLEKIRPTVGSVTLPGDRPWVEQQVTIDFQTKLADIAKQRSATFTGYGPKDKPFYDYSYESVIEAARKAINELATQSKGP